MTIREIKDLHKSFYCFFKYFLWVKEMISCKLNMLLAERRLSVADLHRETGVSRTLLYLMANDDLSRIDLASLDKICDFFDCDVSTVLEFKKNPTE